MSDYTRANAIAYLNGEHTALLQEFGILGTDASAGLKGMLDKAFRALGVTQDALATASVVDTDAGKLEALLDYYALDKFVRAAVGRVSVTKATAGNSVSKQYQQFYDHLKEQRDAAKDRAEELGAISSGAWGYGSYNLDFLEPSGTEDGY